MALQSSIGKSWHVKKRFLATVAAVFSLAAACASEDAGFASGWSAGPDAKCYVMDVRMKDGDSCKAPFLFGFREVKRIGKEIYLNGHVQRFRGYWQQGDPGDKNDLYKYGYNLLYPTPNPDFDPYEYVYW